MMDEARLAEIEARSNAASEAPWVSEATSAGSAVYPAEERADWTAAPNSPYRASGLIPIGIDAICIVQISNNPQWRANRDFIAAARSDVPDLLLLVRQQAARIRELEEALKQAHPQKVMDMTRALKDAPLREYVPTKNRLIGLCALVDSLLADGREEGGADEVSALPPGL